MIRRIPAQKTLDPIVADFCTLLSERSSSYCGDIETSYGSRLSQSTDNSIYQAIPQAILFPKSKADVLAIMSAANKNEYKHLKFTPKGGGTGTNGQSLTNYIVVDMSRHMREIIEINVEEKWVRVQSGVIKDQLNDFLKPYGFFFAPDLSTSNRATIGGMINTDASGQGSLVYGKTSDHVIELDAVTVSGHNLSTKKMLTSEALKIANSDDQNAKIYRQVYETCFSQRNKILETFPRLNRFLTGYDLEHVFNDDLTEFDLGRVLAGSEGTLAFITEAKLNITPIAKFKTMINITYDSFDSALRNSPFLVDAKATSVETIDSTVLNLAKQDVVWADVADLIIEKPGSVVDGLNIVEFNDEDDQNQTAKVSSLCNRLDDLIAKQQSGVLTYSVTNDRADMGRVYAMRKKSVGLLGNVQGDKKPIAFAEDTAVPPENLADFIAEFRAVLDKHNLKYGMFGHVDAGVLHVRPALNMMDPEQEKVLRSISDEVVALTAKYNGLMWGEHGKGYRSEYGPEFFGAELFNELRKIKTAFDSKNRLNPGKICTPLDSNEKLVSVDSVKRGKFDSEIPIEIRQEFPQTINCNGNGLCFNYDESSVMCPSYKATRDRRFSPKGRATLMREWLRLQGENMSPSNMMLAKTTLINLLWLPYKVVFSIGKKLGMYDFSHEVKDSMDACLACKACTSACPVKVDVPTFRSKFLEAYYLRYLRPISDHLVSNVELMMPLLSKQSRLFNALTHNPFSQFLINKVIGYVDAPKLSPHPTQRIDKSFFYSETRYQKLSSEETKNVVFLVQDAFTSSYESQLLADTVIALNGLGFYPLILPFQVNGKAQHVKGFLNRFEKSARKATTYYNKIAKFGRPMIGLDASMALVYRDEYTNLLGSNKVNFKVELLGEWLMSQISNIDLPMKEAKANSIYSVLNHCTEKSLINDSTSHWPTIFSQLGLEAESVNTGCCGMAGTFGHEKGNQTVSKSLFDASWMPVLDSRPKEQILATGFSCRCQSKRFAEASLKHPIQIIADLFK
ncbi:FAD-binding oxidoreductase [Psychrosphaera haliotis]|nr:FAD-binding oxidoreductase [Psychrosphaera haliotis]